MKKLVIFFICVCSAIATYAQGGYNYAKMGVGFSASAVTNFADLAYAKPTRCYSGSFIYNISPYFPVSVEAQVGKVAGGDRYFVKDRYGREYENNFKSLMLHADIQLGEVIDYSYSGVLNAVKNFYAGTGVGAIANSMSFIVREDITNPGYIFPGKNSSINLVVPFRFGYEFKIFNRYDEPQIRLDIGYQHNITFGEGLDGYQDPKKSFDNNAPDQYGQLTLGFKFNFGTITSYNKPIHY